MQSIRLIQIFAKNYIREYRYAYTPEVNPIEQI